VDTGLGEMQLYHVGVAVHDLNDGMRRFGDTFGVRDWVTFESAIASRYRGGDISMGAKVAYGDAGPVYVELVQPTGDRWTASAFLEEQGEGVYHLGYWCDDVPGAVSRAREQGVGVDCSTEANGVPFIVYLEAVGGVHVELVASSIRPVLAEQFGIAPKP
jgi:methylmalonyl-CoA/ethylmalonyl-CoA epimerase